MPVIEEKDILYLVITLLWIMSTVGMTVLITVAEWNILTKAGEKGWKSLIPIYDIYISHEISGMSHFWFITEMIILFIESVLAVFVEFPEWFEIAFLIFTCIFTIVSEIVHIDKLCNCFGKGTGFKIGMFLIPYVFPMILAFGPDKYTPPERKKAHNTKKV